VFNVRSVNARLSFCAGHLPAPSLAGSVTSRFGRYELHLQSRAKRMHVPIFSHHSISCEVFSTIYIWIFNVKIVSVISVYKG